MKIGVLFILIVGFTGSFCTAQQQSKVLTSVLWKVQFPNSAKSSYILGSNHLFGRDWVDSYKVLDSLVTVQEIFLCENTLALGDQDHDVIEQFQQNHLKAKVIFGENFNLVNSYFTNINGFGIEKTIDEHKSPGEVLFFLLYYLLNEIGTKNNLKVSNDFIALDDVLLFKANAMKKDCVGLDSLIQIKKILSSASITDTVVSGIVQLVRAQSSDLSMKKNKSVNEFLKGVITYNQGKHAYNFNDGPSLNDDGGLKVVSRNNFWMQKLPQFLTNQRCFMVVGNGHLGGKKGIISLLRKQGFKISPVELK